MNNSAGIPYEYTVKQKKTVVLTLKRVSLIVFYTLWALLLLLIGLRVRLIVPFLALVPLSIWGWVFFTWRFTQVEYEYSYFAGTLTVSRILGGRSRKRLAEITLRDLIFVRPCTEEAITRVESMQTQKPILAASSIDSPDLYVALWSEDDDRRALYFEPTDKALKIIRSHNLSATSIAK